MKYKLVRMLFVFVAWVVFTVISTSYYMSEIHDVGGTFWAMGFISFPAVIFVVSWFDRFLLKRVLVKNRLWLLTVADCLLAVMLYYPGFVLFWSVFGIFSTIKNYLN